MAPIDPIDYWLMHQRSEKTRKKNQSTLARFANFAEKEPPQLLNDGIRQFCETRQPPLELGMLLIKWYRHLVDEERCSATSARTYFNIVHGFFGANGLGLISLPRALVTDGGAYVTKRVLTQDEVRAMVESQNKIIDKAVIAFLAQTGQREQVLPAITHNMIRRIETGGRSSLHGIVDVSAELRDYAGTPANKGKRHYVFVIGHDAMTLLDSTETSTEWCFPVDWRKIIQLVETAATEVGIQRLIPTRQGAKIREIHPHSLRIYWKSRMAEAKVPDHVSKFMMGHTPGHGATYDRAAYTEENLLRAYVQAERFLNIE